MTAADHMEDIEDKCSEWGNVLEVKIPRPAGVRTSPAIGCIFVKFETLESAVLCHKQLASCSYNDRTCVTSFIGEVCYLLPSPPLLTTY